MDHLDDSYAHLHPTGWARRIGVEAAGMADCEGIVIVQGRRNGGSGLHAVLLV